MKKVIVMAILTKVWLKVNCKEMVRGYIHYTLLPLNAQQRYLSMTMTSSIAAYIIIFGIIYFLIKAIEKIKRDFE